uniref:Regulating synaptic membrane exocytosis 4 n=1 Tax=Bos taurus TaxID=9913 RepID=A0AAA9U145_BOVIN
MERSQSRLSLSASFEALAIYFPCMNSFDDEDAGDSRRLKGAIQRSTETGLAVEMPSRTLRQASHESIEDSMNSYGSEGNLNYGGVCLASDAQFSDFLGSMGPAQFVGRQTLATTPMGDVEIGLQERNGQLEVDIIQARGLTAKPGSKTLPAAYIKAYLLENGICIAKKKTKVARKSLDPLYNQVLLFPESPQGKVLQVIVWGNYGRMERKQFMGVARVLLEELDLTTLAVGCSLPGVMSRTQRPSPWCQLPASVFPAAPGSGSYSCPPSLRGSFARIRRQLRGPRAPDLKRSSGLPPPAHGRSSAAACSSPSVRPLPVPLLVALEHGVQQGPGERKGVPGPGRGPQGTWLCGIVRS